jgi:hypothetical protein
VAALPLPWPPGRGRYWCVHGATHLMSFTASGIGALLAATLRPPHAPWQPVVPMLAGS